MDEDTGGSALDLNLRRLAVHARSGTFSDSATHAITQWYSPWLVEVLQKGIKEYLLRFIPRALHPPSPSSSVTPTVGTDCTWPWFRSTGTSGAHSSGSRWWGQFGEMFSAVKSGRRRRQRVDDNDDDGAGGVSLPNAVGTSHGQSRTLTERLLRWQRPRLSSRDFWIRNWRSHSALIQRPSPVFRQYNIGVRRPVLFHCHEGPDLCGHLRRHRIGKLGAERTPRQLLVTWRDCLPSEIPNLGQSLNGATAAVSASGSLTVTRCRFPFRQQLYHGFNGFRIFLRPKRDYCPETYVWIECQRVKAIRACPRIEQRKQKPGWIVISIQGSS